ncbi:phosphonate C-P lyase system protein PhnH [Chromobacterium vaccinii]|uniref:phosphonate C-P lyase system protein PhnH n=1 Tax=Chromobacterium vaccinii TaxID=1108595 RepID=UPI001E41C280|nr:phosphonate C-P lyase system protein PhnH [Chromobacterium vaccinii]MCD4485554.1 phosphonate C-P lyase system protein PhnH [Chromobacterium vaccinii]
MRSAFAHPVDDAQRTFRAALSAMAEPLLPRPLPVLPPVLPGLQAATAALLYTLADQDVRVWLPALPDETVSSLRFHTGMRLADLPEDADFIIIAAGMPLPDLMSLKAGSAEYPDRSATLLIEVDGFAADQVEGSGPGFAAPRRFGAAGLSAGFWKAWQDNHVRFPLGVDAVLISDTHIAGLPRSARIREG